MRSPRNGGLFSAALLLAAANLLWAAGIVLIATLMLFRFDYAC
jgi:hypothetical protein